MKAWQGRVLIATLATCLIACGAKPAATDDGAAGIVADPQFVARNDAWVTKLDRRLRDGHDDDTLVVVGSLHLLGDDGVVEKLRAKGYKVERICSACTPSTATGTR